MDSLSHEDFIKMQEEAVLNARNMKKRAIKGNGEKSANNCDEGNINTDSKVLKGNFQKSCDAQRNVNSAPLFSTFKADENSSFLKNEDSILLTFLLILIFDKADKILIFALIYIML